MTLFVDATTAQHARGIGTVIDGLIRVLPMSFGSETTVAIGPSTPPPPGLRVRRIALARTRVGRLAYQRLLLPLDLAVIARKAREVDRVLLLDSYLPLVRPQRGVRYASLVHDVLPLTNPEFWPLPKRLVKRSAFLSLQHAGQTVFTSTQHNADQFRRATGMDARVVRFGCGQLSDAEADRALDDALPERRPYLVHVGAIEPRKDIFTTISAFEAVARSAPHDFGLVLVGRGHPRYVASIHERIARSPVARRICVVTHADREETLRLIAHAGILIVSSRAEGFGLPILEALALGTPVVSSDLDGIRSWAGNAIAYAPPGEPSRWVASIEAALETGSERRRSGQEFARGFRWRDCVAGLLDF